MGKIAFSVCGLDLYWFGLVIALSVLIAFVFISIQAVISKKSLTVVLDLTVYSIPAALICARVYYVLANWNLYKDAPLEGLYLWRGGLAIYGAIIGFTAAFYIYCRLNKEPFGSWLDLFTPGLALGQAAGQWANLINQEAFGYPTGLPWGIYIDFACRPSGFEQFDYFQPVFLYESLLNFSLFILLLIMAYINRKRRFRPGWAFLLYLLFFVGGHYFFEGLRMDLDLP